MTFKKENQSQLTTRGLQNIEVMTARIYAANGLRILGEGIAIRQPEDAADDEKGAKLALARAVEDANSFWIFDKPARKVIFDAFVNHLQREKLEKWAKQQKLNRQLEAFAKAVQQQRPIAYQAVDDYFEEF